MIRRVREAGRRIQQLASGPVAPARRVPLVGPMLRWMFARPRIHHDRIAELARRLQRRKADGGLPGLLSGAVRQLERGVGAVERAARLTGRVPAAELGWLWRLHQIVYRAAQLCDESSGRRPGLTVADVVGDAQLAPMRGASGAPKDGPAATAVDPLLDAARHEFRWLGRKRRWLEAARQQLLQASAAGGLDAAAVRARRRAIARQVARLDRLQAAGLAPDVELMHQVREARAHRDLARLVAALTALEEGALAADQPELALAADRALGCLWGGRARASPESAKASLARSLDQQFAGGTRARIQAAYSRARDTILDVRRQLPEDVNDTVEEQLRRYLADHGADELMTAALAADGCFDLGGTVSPVRSLELEQRLIQVRHPTQHMTLVPAQGVADLPAAIIDDPRTVLASLAAGTLLTRRYLAVESRTTERRGLRNDARFYLLDGSGSMTGPRARMRDALLMAELATLEARLADGRRAGNPVLYYRYFTKEVGPVTSVATAAQAQQALEDIAGTVRVGGTDIEAALLASFEHIRAARATDPDLVHAQLVLITDGEATVDLPAVAAARARVGDLPIGVSIIALGEENPALRQLAVDQRAKGEPVFYQYMDDGELDDVVSGRLAGPPVHLPADQGAAALTPAFDELLREMDQRLRPLDASEIQNASVLEAALGEVSSIGEQQPAFTDGERARREALMRDEATVKARFLRWFPRVPDGTPLAPLAESDEQLLASVIALLATVAEVLGVGTTGLLERRSDAIEIMERLLADQAIPPWRYADLLRRQAPRLRGSLAAIHGLVAEQQP
jgi:hypothetical protein